MANTKITTSVISDGAITSAKLDTDISVSGSIAIGNTVASSMDAGANNLVVGTGSGTEGITIYSGTGNSGVIYFADSASGDDRFRGQIGYSHGDDAFNFRTNASSSPNMTIDSSGNVGIGNTSPLGKLTISNAAGTNAPTTVTAANTYLQLGSDDYGPSGNGKFMIGFGYTDATNTNSPAYIGFEETTSSGDTKGVLTFYTRDVITDTAPTERMRIDSSGTFMVAKTSASSNNVGFQTTSSGGTAITRSGGQPLLLNRQTDDGDIAIFRKDGSTVGSIGTEGTELTIGTTTAGLQFLGSEGKIRPFNVSTNSASNGVVDLGRSNAKFKDLYLSGAIKMDSDLDDYEEGTWTPNFSDTSGNLSNAVVASSQTGTYTKIGNLVSVQGYFYQNGNDTNMSATLLRIAGLPFANSSTHSIGTIRTLDIFVRQPTVRFTRVYLPSGANYLEVTRDNGNQNLASGTNNWEVQASVANVNSVGANNCAVVFQITYATTT